MFFILVCLRGVLLGFTQYLPRYSLFSIKPRICSSLPSSGNDKVMILYLVGVFKYCG